MAPSRRKTQQQEGFVRLILVAPFLDFLDRRRIDYSAAIHNSGLDPDKLRDPNAFVHAEVVYGLLNALADAAGDPYLGVHAGEVHAFADWPPFYEAATKSATLGEFFTRFLQAVPQEANSVRHVLRIAADGASYEVERQLVPRNSPGQTEGFGVAHYVRLFRSIAGATWDPGQVTIHSAYPEGIPPGYMSIRVVKKPEGGLELRFPTAWLFAPLELNYRLAAAPSSLRQKSDDVSLVAALRAAATSRIGDLSFGAAEVARVLGLEEARLQAALKTSGSSIARELRRLRVDLAREALADPTRSIAEISDSFGYSDPAHFTRFFRSQTGQSPRDYRGSLKTAER